MQSEMDIPDAKRNGDQPHSQLEIYNKVIDGGVDDEFLDKLLLGLGNYSDSEMWQQVEAYQKGMYANEAFARRLIARAIEDTKWHIAENGWHYEDEVALKNGTTLPIELEYEGWTDLSVGEREVLDKRRSLEAAADWYWQDIQDHRYGNRLQLEAMREVTGIGEEWIPPHWRMLQMRHDASRSKGARLVDNVFGRVKRQEYSEEGDSGGGGGILSRGKETNER